MSTDYDLVVVGAGKSLIVLEIALRLTSTATDLTTTRLVRAGGSEGLSRAPSD